MILWSRKKSHAPLSYRRIVLTGAASGIGRALLAQLADLPAQIVAVDRDAGRLAETLASLHAPQARILPVSLDVACSAGIDALFDQASAVIGGIDLFIANAGFALYGPAHQHSWSQLDYLFRTNTLAPIYAATKMAQLNGAEPYKMVIIASAMAHTALPGYAAYAGSKAALHRFAEAYRFELPDPRRLMLVYPIATRTGFFGAAARQPAPLPWPVQSPERVAQAVLQGLSRHRPVVYPASTFWLYRLAERLLPWLRRAPQLLAQRQLQRWLQPRPKL